MKIKIKKENLFSWYYIRFFGMLSVRAVKLWIKLHRKPYYIDLKTPIKKDEEIVFASNHQSMLDSPAIFASLTFLDLKKTSPVKFMTYHKYYNSIYKLALYSTGCFPSHGKGNTGVEGAVNYAKEGYRPFVFPEGKRTNLDDDYKTYGGISQILEKLPSARLVLVFINWEKRKRFLSRPKLTVVMFDAPDSVDRSDPYSIMNAIYEKGNDTL